MQRLQTEYKIKVEKIKRENLLFFFSFWVLVYIFLLTMSNLGPYKYIEDILTTSLCNRNLLLGPNHTKYDSNASIGCQFCKDFQRIETKLFALKIKLLPIGGVQHLEKTDIPIKISKFSNEYYFIDNPCTKINAYSDLQHFPSLNLEDYVKRQAFDQFNWTIDYSNRKDTAHFICKSEEFSLNMCNSNLFYEEIGDYKNLAYFIEIQTNNETSKFNRALFEVIYENPKYYSFLNIFKCFFLICTLFILLYSYLKLKNLQFNDWLPFHKWIFFMLTVQSLKDFPYMLLNEIIFDPSTYYIILLIFEFIFEFVLYLFWLAIYEMALPQLTFTKWKMFSSLKIIIIYVIVTLNFALRFHIWDHHIQINFFEEYLRKIFFENSQLIHLGIYSIYIIYFLILNYFSYCHILSEHISKLYGIIFILTTIVFLFNMIMEWRFYLSPLTISIFSYIAFNGVLNIYIYVFAFLYLPQDFQNTKSQKFKEKDTEIINNVYGEELQEEELKPVSIKKEDEHKEKIWSQIEENVKAEQYDDYDDEIDKEEEEEDEEYIYV